MAKTPPTSPQKSKQSRKDVKPEKRRSRVINPEDELKRAFDPMKNLHLWTMWRSAVNGRIVDEIKGFQEQDFREHPFGRSLTRVPLNKLIKYEKGSNEIASNMMDPSRSRQNHTTPHNHDRSPGQGMPRSHGQIVPHDQRRHYGQRVPHDQRRHFGQRVPHDQRQSNRQSSPHEHRPPEPNGPQGPRSLETRQFVFYGVPRVVLKK